MRPAFIYLALFIAVLSMSTSSIMIRYITAPALIIALYRVIFTAGLTALLSRTAPTGIKQLQRRDLAYILASGVFLALHLGLWITSLNHTSISSSVLFTNLQVIFVLLLSAWLLKERVNRWVQGGIGLALLGSLLIMQGDLQSGRLLGDMLALLSGLFIAIYFDRTGRALPGGCLDVYLHSRRGGLSGSAGDMFGLGIEVDQLPPSGLDIIPAAGGRTGYNWARFPELGAQIRKSPGGIGIGTGRIGGGQYPGLLDIR